MADPQKKCPCKGTNTNPSNDDWKGRIQSALDSMPPVSAGSRITEYIAENPDSWTHHITRDCAVMNVPDVVAKMESILAMHGLNVYCYLPPKGQRCITRHRVESIVNWWRIQAIGQPKRQGGVADALLHFSHR